MGSKDSKIIENNEWPIRIEFCSRVGIVSMMASECCHPSLMRTKKLKIASDVPIILPRTS